MKRYVVVFDDNRKRVYYDTLDRDSKYHAQCYVEVHGGYYEIMTEKQFEKYRETATAKWEAEQNKIMWKGVTV